MNPRTASRLLAIRKASQPPAFDINTYLFKEQLAFINDPSRFADAVCSVRAGKTVACAADLINTAITMPGTTGIYITLTIGSAERIVWPELLSIIEKFQLPFKINYAKLVLTHKLNNSKIILAGANDEKAIEKIRGLSNVALVYLDEAQLFRSYIKELVEDIITKRLYDTNGRCRLIGTPGPVLTGYFYDCVTSDRWPHHYWTMHNNPHLFRKSGKTPDELIQQDLLIQGVTIDHPSIQRECFGRWKHDPEALLLNYDASINHYESLPPGEYEYILGIDLGVRDSDSLSLIAFSRTSPITYLVEEIVTPNQKTDDLAKQIKELMKLYPIKRFPTDAGGLGLKIVEDLKARYSLPLVAADKREKMANYKHLNNALRNGNVKAKKNSMFALDCTRLEKDRDKSTADRIVVKGHSDAVDSMLYAFKLSPAYAYVPAVSKPLPGTAAYDKAQEDLHIEAAIAAVKKQRDMQTGKGEMNSWSKDAKGIANWNKW